MKPCKKDAILQVASPITTRWKEGGMGQHMMKWVQRNLRTTALSRTRPLLYPSIFILVSLIFQNLEIILVNL